MDFRSSKYRKEKGASGARPSASQVRWNLVASAVSRGSFAFSKLQQALIEANLNAQSGRSSKAQCCLTERLRLVTACGHWMRERHDMRHLGCERDLLGRSFIIRQTPKTHPPSRLTYSRLARDPYNKTRLRLTALKSSRYPLLGLSPFR